MYVGFSNRVNFNCTNNAQSKKKSSLFLISLVFLSKVELYNVRTQSDVALTDRDDEA